MVRPIEDIRDINHSKELGKVVVRIKDLWDVMNMSNKEHLKMVLIDEKVYV